LELREKEEGETEMGKEEAAEECEGYLSKESSVGWL
jgi:hypothetical protein